MAEQHTGVESLERGAYKEHTWVAATLNGNGYCIANNDMPTCCEHRTSGTWKGLANWIQLHKPPPRRCWMGCKALETF